MSCTLATHFSRNSYHSDSVLTDIVLVKNVLSVQFHNQAAFLIFLEHFIPLKVQQIGSCVIAAQLPHCNILANSSESSACCASVLCYWSCFQLWIHGSGWHWPDAWTFLLTGRQGLLSSQTCGLLQISNEIITYRQPTKTVCPVSHYGEKSCNLNINVRNNSAFS